MSGFVGQCLNHYRIVEKIGEGGMGEVYRAHDERLDRDVAIKVLPEEVVEDCNRLERFEREARAAAALDHPNVLAVHELGTHRGRPFIVMELLDGRTVREAIDSGDLAGGDVIELGSQIAKGLAAAHDRGILHRDIKPSNVFISSDGAVKILDFGLAKLAVATLSPHEADEAPTEEMMTAVGTVLGTAGYMSPEQVRGMPSDHRSDIFSLGVVLYEMSTGMSPFRRETAADTASAVLAEDPPPMTEVSPWASPGLDGVVRRCLKKRPEDRFQSAEDVGNALLELPDTPAGSRRQRTPTRPATKALSISAVMLISIVAFTLLYVGYRVFLGHVDDDAGGALVPRIVVLPFDNLGPTDDAYFADGVTEEITGRLAMVSGLQVVSRTTARRYADSGKSTSEIGEELGVGYLLEGSVRWARMADGSQRVRIAPQLIRVADDSHLWAQRYDRELDDMFRVQSEIAEQVAAELGVTLVDTERRVVREQPTENLEAYQAYIRGRWLAAQPHFTYALWPQMFDSFERAVELDPSFALAHAEIARSHAELRYYGYDFSAQRLSLATQAAERAAALAPLDPRVHLTLAEFCLLASRDTESASAEIEVARRSLGASNTEVLRAEIFLREIEGRFDDALDLADEVMRLDPLDPYVPSEAIFDSWGHRDYPRAIGYADAAFLLAPGSFWPSIGKAWVYWSWSGDLESSRVALEGLTRDSGDWIRWTWYWQEIFEGRFEQALRRFDADQDSWQRTKFGHRPSSFMRAAVLEFMGREEEALVEWRSALELIDQALEDEPENYLLHASSGVAHAALGERERAIEAGQRAMELLPVSKDARYGLVCEVDMARIFTMLGEHDLALNQLDRLLTIPSWVSVPWIEVNPLWEPLRDHPRYAGMLESHRRAGEMAAARDQHIVEDQAFF